MKKHYIFGILTISCLAISCSDEKSYSHETMDIPFYSVRLEDKLFEYPRGMLNYYSVTNYGMNLSYDKSTSVEWLLYFDPGANTRMDFRFYAAQGATGQLTVEYYDGTSVGIPYNRCYLSFLNANKVGILERKEYFFGINLIENGHIVAFDTAIFYPNGDMLPDEKSEHWMIEEIKGYSFPMIDGEYQDVTEKQTKYMFDFIKKEYKGKYYQPNKNN